MLLKPFRIGQIEIGLPVVLAALAGYSDLAYRRICRRLGAPYAATEMMLDRMLLGPNRQQRRMARIEAADHPVAGQLVGNSPDDMTAGAAALEEMGFDVIDLNFACPVRKALGRKRGGFLMGEPDQAIAITRAVCAVAEKPVTLKLRQKFADADNEDAFWRIAEAAFDAGAAAICAHARSVEQKYSGPADWEFLARVKQHFSDKTIIGSGDVLTPAKALDMLRQTGVDAASAARGCLGNPWFFRQVRDLAEGREPYQPGLAEQRALMLEHLEGSCELYGPLRGSKHMRKFGIKYARLHPSPKHVRMAFVAARKPADWHEVLRLYYGEGNDECQMLNAKCQMPNEPD
jgi:nifR3 family TIM-barrel protein